MVQFDTVPLPAHARLIASADVWMEGSGVSQLSQAASLPGCVRAVGMPDLHAGKGPVGAVFATRGKVYPHLLGGDVGCGVRLFATTETATNRDAIERRVRKAWDEDSLLGCDREAVFEAAFGRGLLGLSRMESAPDGLRELAASVLPAAALATQDTSPTSIPSAFRGRGFGDSLATVGGGNHFVEIARVDEIRDSAEASRLGLERGRLVVIAHSGSRGLGQALARAWEDAPLEGPAIDRYLLDLEGASRFARVNRFLLAYRALRALGASRPSKIAGTFDVTHNDVREEPLEGSPVWVHRKGAAPAYEGQPTIVLGSRGAPSWVLAGTGAEDGLRSVAHGAGRRMTRTEARGKMKAKYKRADLTRTKLGSRVLCDDADLLYEEHPEAYKPIGPVVASLIDAGLATPVASLTPVVTVKR